VQARKLRKALLGQATLQARPPHQSPEPSNQSRKIVLVPWRFITNSSALHYPMLPWVIKAAGNSRSSTWGHSMTTYIPLFQGLITTATGVITAAVLAAILARRSYVKQKEIDRQEDLRKRRAEE